MFRIIALFIFHFFLQSYSLLEITEVKAQPADLGSDSTPEVSSRLEFEDILIAAKKAATGGNNTIESLLANLPQDQLTSLPYVLMYDSQSSQKASDRDPRMIFWNKKTSLIVSINGHPQLEGGQSVETIVYDDKTNQYIFREITMPFDPAKPPEVNPEKCMKCHGNPPRPSWNQYPSWPGAVGSDDELIFRSQRETILVGDLTQTWSSHPRFKYFNSPQQNFQFSNIPPSSRKKGQPGRNTELGIFLNSLNKYFIINQLTKNPNFKLIRYAFFAAVNCLDTPIKDFLYPMSNFDEQAAAADLQQKTHDHSASIVKHRKNLADPFNKEILGALGSSGSSGFLVSLDSRRITIDDRVTTRLKFLLDLININLADWTLTPERESMSFNDGDLNIRGFFGKVAGSLIFDQTFSLDLPFRQLNHHYHLDRFNDGNLEERRYCEKLKELSLANVEQVSPAGALACVPGNETIETDLAPLQVFSDIMVKMKSQRKMRNRAGKKLFEKKCSRCHKDFIGEFSEDTVGQFYHRVEESLQGINGRKKMPLEKPLSGQPKDDLSQEERESILSYVMSLKSHD